METLALIDQYILYFHIFCGFSSLIIFWIPVFTKKGGTAHRKVGMAYVYTMGGVVISAAILSVINAIQGGWYMAAFLGFLSIITGHALWNGMAVLSRKRGLDDSYRRTNNLLDGITAVSGLALLIIGLATITQDGSSTVLVIFGILGILAAPRLIANLKNPPTESDWLWTHLSGFLTTGIAAHTAFFVFGGARMMAGIFDGYWVILPWIAPTVIGTIALRRMKKKYSKKYARL